jgi:3-isopropylmalate/(R)-2-methylmalate dehydratase small subunit
MKPVKRIEATAAPLMVENISTDVISPSVLYEKVDADFAGGLFGPWRYDASGNDNPEFVLNQPRFAGTRILVTGSNFGCGSSREIAVWCLTRYGIEAVIAPSFGEIFAENSFKNGLVLVELPQRQVDAIAASLANAAVPRVAVDLEQREIEAPGNRFNFTMDEMRRTALMEGLDELAMILREEPATAAFQEAARKVRPWQFQTDLPMPTRGTTA